MATTDFSSLGTMQTQVVEANNVNIYEPSNDSFKLILKLSDSALAADVNMNVPTSGSNLLSDGSNIEVTQLDINGATSNSILEDADEIVFYDSTNNENRKISVSDFKSETNELPAPAAGDLLVADSTATYTAQAMSGDATMSDSAVLTISADAVDGSKIADDAIDSEHIVDGAVDDSHVASLTGVTDGEVLASSLVKVDASRNCTGFENVGCNSLEFGDSTNRFRFNINGTQLQLQVSSDSGSTYSNVQLFGA